MSETKDREIIFLFVSKMQYGGQERFVSRLSYILDEIYEVIVVVFDDSEMTYSVSGKVISLGLNQFPSDFIGKVNISLKRIHRFRNVLNQYKPIACISFGVGPDFVNLFCKQRGTQVMPSIRGYTKVEKLEHNFLLRLLYSRADGIISCSKTIQDSIGRIVFREKLEKSYLLNNAYDCEEILRLSRQKPTNIVRGKSFSICSVGTYRYEKGYWHLLKSIFLLAEKGFDVKLTIVGPDQNGHRKQVQSLAEALHIQDKVRLLEWHENPYSVISQNDLYVLSSVREGFPNALVEAMACNVPVVAMDCPSGPREILAPSFDGILSDSYYLAEYGILVPLSTASIDYSTEISNEDRNLALAIEEMIKDEAKRRAYAELARKRALDYSYESCKKQFMEIIGHRA